MDFMKYFSCVFLFIFFTSMSAFSQEKHIKHTVLRGETISEIAEYYKVKPQEIYELNPKAKKGIKSHSVLLIPTNAKKNKILAAEIAINQPEKKHEVLTKETVYGIAKLYNVSVEDLYKINTELEKEGLKKGQIIKIPRNYSDNLVVTTSSENPNEILKPNISTKTVTKEEVVVLSKLVEKGEAKVQVIVRVVLPKETLYSIAKQYGITVIDLKNANPTIGNKALQMGQKIAIPVKLDNNLDLADKENTSTNENVQVNSIDSKQTNALIQTVLKNPTVETETTHEVLPKETKYSIAKEYGISVKELEKQNPKISKQLPIGYVLKIRSSKVIEATVATEEFVVAKEEVLIEDSNQNTNKDHGAVFVDQLVFTASENIGIRYRYGGATKEGFDCSGLMYTTFATYNIILPRSSIEMASCGSKINSENAQKGDLIFFKTRGRRKINHVGMVVEVCNGEIKFIHSSSQGVIISSTKESYYGRNFAQINRVL
jgi:cell wall-associated NlpC family hydrolase